MQAGRYSCKNLTRDMIARFEYGTREFDSVFFQNNFAYLTCWVPSESSGFPMEFQSPHSGNSSWR